MVLQSYVSSPCPKCGKGISFAVSGNANSYFNIEKGIPALVAYRLHSGIAVCQYCNVVSQIVVPGSRPARIAMEVRLFTAANTRLRKTGVVLRRTRKVGRQ